MKRKFLLLVFALALLTAISFFMVDRTVYSDFVASKLEGLARSARIRLTLTEPELALVGLNTESATLVSEKAPFPLYLTNCELRTSLLPLLSGNWRTSLQANAYQGLLKITSEGNFDGSIVEGDFQIDDVHLSEHQQLAGIGISSGTLSVLEGAFRVEEEQLRNLHLHLSLEDLEISGGTPIPVSWQGSQVPVSIPKFHDANITSTVQIEGPQVKIDDFQFTSSIGEITFDLTASDAAKQGFSEPTQVVLRVDGSAALAPTGLRLLGDWLPLISRGALKSTDASFSFSLRGSLANPVFKATPSRAPHKGS